MTDLPQWAMEKAEKLGATLYGRQGFGLVRWPATAWNEEAPRESIARALVEAKQQGREEMRKGIQDLLAHGAPHSPRRYIYDTTPDRRNWANDQLDESIRKLAAQEGK